MNVDPASRQRPAGYASAKIGVPIRLGGTRVAVPPSPSPGLASTDDRTHARQDTEAAADTAQLQSQAVPRSLRAGQRSQIWVGGPGIDAPELLFETDRILLEAPNWTFDGAVLVLNGAGRLWRLDVADPVRGPREIVFVDLSVLNNDHVLGPDGTHVYLSAMDGHIYRAHMQVGRVEVHVGNAVWSSRRVRERRDDLVEAGADP